MTLTRRAFLASSAATVVAACLPNSTRGTIRLAAGDRGGLYLAVCEIFAERLRVRYPGITVTVMSTAGSVDNLELLRSGQADMALAQADVVEQQLRSGPAPDAPLAVARVYENYVQLVVPDQSAIRQVNDLAGLTVSTGPAGSGVAAVTTVLFRAANLTDRVRRTEMRLNEAVAALGNHTIDALVWSGGIPTPAIAELDKTLPLRILDLTPWVAPMSELASYPYLLLRTPIGAYVPASVYTIGSADLLLCRPGLPNPLVAAAVDVLATDATQLMPPEVRGLQYLQPPSMIQTGRTPLHPGAIEQYRILHG
ncbi:MULTISPECIES: TAXI family TRAP transporter solute-binding subunit [Mycolicibacterium]|uniref:TAXI family TRAP transporter solute-binding subunit n=1 Tax=Mycolicibacterium TaxID=1866885 RepID=UPI000FAF05E5|nr:MULTISPECIES: TAXI family TRAP transporter solute-binding subunit [Mycolicibacterium]RUP26215.1 MAG: TAXI family TRAP transporter solute-binding subunit [Mycolicibacterium sp.]UCZ62729.1 TAXI family TRAP transporter solute-binding subunit [Mycolicibacterium phocaicum]